MANIWTILCDLPVSTSEPRFFFQCLSLLSFRWVQCFSENNIRQVCFHSSLSNVHFIQLPTWHRTNSNTTRENRQDTSIEVLYFWCSWVNYIFGQNLTSTIWLQAFSVLPLWLIYVVCKGTALCMPRIEIVLHVFYSVQLTLTYSSVLLVMSLALAFPQLLEVAVWANVYVICKPKVLKLLAIGFYSIVFSSQSTQLEIK